MICPKEFLGAIEIQCIPIGCRVLRRYQLILFTHFMNHGICKRLLEHYTWIHKEILCLIILLDEALSLVSILRVNKHFVANFIDSRERKMSWCLKYNLAAVNPVR